MTTQLGEETEREIRRSRGVDPNSQVETPKLENSIPTQDELSAQIRMTEPMIGVPKKGGPAVQVWDVEDGYAFRAFGTPETSEIQWARESDLLDNYELFRVVNHSGMAEAFTSLVTDRDRWRKRCHLAVNCMGTASLRRYRQETEIDLERLSNDTLRDIDRRIARSKQGQKQPKVETRTNNDLP